MAENANSSFSSLYSVIFEASVRTFSRQHTGTRIDAVKIYGDSLDEWKRCLWGFVEPHLKRKVIFIDGKPEWHANISPEEADMGDFLSFHDKKSKSIYRLPEISTQLLHQWARKNILLTIHQYSCSVDTAPVFKNVQEVLIKPFEKDRSNAISNAALMVVVAELKRIHQYHYISHDINYVTWASYIVAQDAHLKETLLHSPPPASIIELFRYAPMESDRVLNDVRRNVSVASSLNADYSEEVFELQDLVSKLNEIRQQESIILQTIQSKLDGMKNRALGRTSIIDALQDQISPEENGLSAEAISRVTPQIDIDHE